MAEKQIVLDKASAEELNERLRKRIEAAKRNAKKRAASKETNVD